MKKTSKILSAFLAVMLTAALAIPAFAAGTTVTVEYDYKGYPVKGTLSNVVKTVQYTERDGNGNQSAFTIYVISDQGAKLNVSFVSKPTDPEQFPMNKDDYGMWYEIIFRGFGNWNPETKCLEFDNGGELWALDGTLDFGFDYSEQGDNVYYLATGKEMIYLMHESEFAQIPADMYTVLSGGTQPTTPDVKPTPGTKPAPGVSVPLNDGSGEFAYTVKRGDTLGKIAAYYYGNVNVYKLIYERNKDILKSANSIYAGQTIILPSYAAVAKGVATTQPGTPSKPGKPGQPNRPSANVPVKPAPGVSVPLNDGSGEFAYTIKSGDTLSRIAAYYYGNANVYKLIYERNKDILKSASAIYAGQTIILPSYAAVAQGVAKI